MFESDSVANVWTVEAGDKVAAVLQAQPVDYLASCPLVGGCRERDAGNFRKEFGEHRKLQIIGAEIVTPLRDAMRLIDRKERDCCALQKGDGAILIEALGGDIEQIESAAAQIRLNLGRFRGVES